MRVVVTGGAGFIGTNLVRELLKAGFSPVVLDNFATGFRENVHGLDAGIVEGTILDPEVLDRAFEGAEAVVHLAARPSVPKSITDPLASNDANVNGTLQVLEAARRHHLSHVIVASSSSVYGANLKLPKREDLVPMPISPYAVSKLAAEAYSLAYSSCFDLDVLALRFFNVFGPYQPAGHTYAAVVPAFVTAALSGQPLMIHGDGRQTRDFTYVGNVVRILIDALRRRVCSPLAVNLAFGERISVLELADRIGTIVGLRPQLAHVDPRLGDIRDSQADNRRLLELFPDISPTSVDDGLSETIDWFQGFLVGLRDSAASD
ncbi:MAG TPA: NAD-dependent epimerase/dehydratase family protein [Acidimicrobiales bacterium]|nr:NAD-dependent epimerase/dehydratase family protein [Acidimicrobiales bacterium]